LLLLGATPEETHDTQMCRDNMVENHWSMVKENNNTEYKGLKNENTKDNLFSVFISSGAT